MTLRLYANNITSSIAMNRCMVTISSILLGYAAGFLFLQSQLISFSTQTMARGPIAIATATAYSRDHNHTSNESTPIIYQSSSYPGRFKEEAYPNQSTVVQFETNPKASPYQKSCAPGLTCFFSDKTWHEMGWHNNNIIFPESPKSPNNIFITLESQGHAGHATSLKRGPRAGLATTNFNSDIPLSYAPAGLKGIFQPKSSSIQIWRVLHVASNCDRVQSDRNILVELLASRGLLDSYGKCHNNKVWNSTVRSLPKGGGMKESLTRRYAFVTAFENSYFPGYITEKLWVPLGLGTLPIYLGAPNAKAVFPKKSFIDANNFFTYDDLADYIEFLIENRGEYDKYHEWRNESVSIELEKFWKFLDQDDNCRICRWGAENLFS